jgi:hypothetical protein
MFVLLLCLLVLSQSACRNIANLCLDKAVPSCGEVVSDFKIDNPRFEFPAPTQPLQGGQDFWLRAGDSLNAAWDSFVLSLAQPGAMCTASTPASPPACQQCNIVNQNANDCPSVFVPTATDFLTVESFAGFNSNAPAQLIGHISHDGVAALSFSFTPTENATIRLTTTIEERGTLAESKVFVVSPGTQMTATFRMDALVQIGVSDATFYSGSLSRNPVLSDNFSTNLRIGKVRVLQGKVSSDPLSGKLQIKDASVLHPSRIVLIPDYNGNSVYSDDSLRCYSDTSADGGLDFTNCRTSPGGTGGSMLDATPAYLKFAPQSVLTWVAEFKPAEGGVIPTVGPDETLAIEFTIQ